MDKKKRKKSLQRDIIKYFSSNDDIGPRSLHNIYDNVVGHNYGTTVTTTTTTTTMKKKDEKMLNKILCKMVQKRKLSVHELDSVPVIHVYSIPIPDDNNERKSDRGTNYFNSSSTTFESKELHHSNTDSETVSKNIDVDDEIQRLEAEIAAYSDSGSESDNHMSEDDGVICLSEFASDRIVSLAKTLLPTGKSKKLKIDKEGEGGGANNSENMPMKKKKRKMDGTGSSNDNGRVNEGLREAVKEVLSSYQPSKHLPFYCRVCLEQSSDKDEFYRHKKSEFHRLAVQMEKKATFCKLCRKQFTSIIQMKEHLSSKPHKEKMDSVKLRQRGMRPSGQSGGRVDSESKLKHNDDRQWC